MSSTKYFSTSVSVTEKKWYDGADRLVEVDNAYTKPEGWLTRYLYDLSAGAGVSLSATGTFQAHGGLFATQLHGTTWLETRGTAFDALDRQVRSYRWPMSCGSPCGSVYSATSNYDATGKLGLLSSTVNEVGGTAMMFYDAAGRETATSYSNDGGITPNEATTYDADGRVVAKSSATLGTVSNAYDFESRLISHVEPSSSGVTSPATLTYDYYGDGTKKDVNVSSSALTKQPLFQYSYRADGLKKTLAAAMPDGAQSFTWTYTNAGRLLTASSSLGSTAQTFSTVGRVASKTMPGGTLSSIGYDSQDEPTIYSAYGSSSITNSYDALQELTGVNYTQKNGGCVPPAFPSESRTYAFGVMATASKITGCTLNDPDNLFTTVSTTQVADKRSSAITQANNVPLPIPSPGPGCTQNPYDNYGYSYDQAGRETSGTYNWAYTSGSKSCSYHTGTGSMSQTFNTKNQLVARTENSYYSHGTTSPATASISYWPDGHPSVSQNDLALGYYSTLHWDGDELLFVTNNAGALEEVMIDGPLAMYQPSTKTVVVERDLSGMRLGFYGNGSVPTLNPSPRFGAVTGGFPAPEIYFYKSLDAVSGPNTFQGVRTTDPITNQWTAPDAYPGRIADPLSQRAYTWNNNNPVVYDDPSGYCIPCGAVIVAGVEIAVGDVLTAVGAGLAGGAIARNGHYLVDASGRIIVAGFDEARDLASGKNRKTSKGQKERITNDLGTDCFYCGQPTDPDHDPKNKKSLETDHYISIKNGGDNGINNKVPACRGCNNEKGSMNGGDFLDAVEQMRQWGEL